MRASTTYRWQGRHGNVLYDIHQHLKLPAVQARANGWHMQPQLLCSAARRHSSLHASRAAACSAALLLPAALRWLLLLLEVLRAACSRRWGDWTWACGCCIQDGAVLRLLGGHQLAL